MAIKRDSASFRDPSGHVYELDNRILRTITTKAKSHYEYVRDSKVINRFIKNEWVIDTKEINDGLPDLRTDNVCYIVEHSKIPYISYPYEWSFEMLKAAALRHLEIQIELLKNNISLSDASAYNIQFDGANPMFIDYLSFRRYVDGEFWLGHQQFCEQFLNPLLLRSYIGISHNSWFRGSMEGITTSDINKLLPLYRKFSWRVFTNICLPDLMQKKAVNKNKIKDESLNKMNLQKQGYTGMLAQLHNWIDGLSPSDTTKTTWSDYATTHSYSNDEEKAKHNFIKEFVDQTQPEFVIDLGCNTGEYSETALEAGAKYIVGYDYDLNALDQAYNRAKDKQLKFLPLYLDAANPSPNQGWREKERKGFTERINADAIIALALEHHLAIGRNIALDDLVEWLVSLAPKGIIEFVQKSDPMIQKMLALREDIFSDYTEDNFKSALEKNARIVKREVISSTNRSLYWFERS